MEEELFKKIVYTTLEYDFIPMSDYNIKLYGKYDVLGYYIDNNSDGKILWSDVDGVVNTGKPIFVNYIKDLCKYNKNIGNFTDIIFKKMAKMNSNNFNQIVNEINGIFKKCDIQYEEHRKACIDSIEDIPLAPNLLECISTLKRMKYDIFFISGSPDESIKNLISRRLGLPTENGFGSQYIFKHGEFQTIYPILYENKKKLIQNLTKELNIPIRNLSTVISDEMGDIEMARSIINPFLLTEPEEKIFDDKNNIIFKIPSFKEDSRILTKSILKIERAFCLFFGYSEKERDEIFKSAIKSNKRYDELLEKHDNQRIRNVKNLFVKEIKKYFENAREIFPIFLSDIENDIYMLEKAQSVDDIRKYSTNVWDKFTKYSPDPTIAENLDT